MSLAGTVRFAPRNPPAADDRRAPPPTSASSLARRRRDGRAGHRELSPGRSPGIVAGLPGFPGCRFAGALAPRGALPGSRWHQGRGGRRCDARSVPGGECRASYVGYGRRDAPCRPGAASRSRLAPQPPADRVTQHSLTAPTRSCAPDLRSVNTFPVNVSPSQHCDPIDLDHDLAYHSEGPQPTARSRCSAATADPGSRCSAATADPER